MRKPTIGICENKDVDQLRSYSEADQRLCIVQFLFYLVPKFQAPTLYISVSIIGGPVRKP